MNVFTECGRKNVNQSPLIPSLLVHDVQGLRAGFRLWCSRLSWWQFPYDRIHFKCKNCVLCTLNIAYVEYSTSYHMYDHVRFFWLCIHLAIQVNLELQDSCREVSPENSFQNRPSIPAGRAFPITSTRGFTPYWSCSSRVGWAPHVIPYSLTSVVSPLRLARHHPLLTSHHTDSKRFG